MILASQIRANARETLRGRWGKAALVILVALLMTFLLGLLNVIPVLGGLIVTVLGLPFSYGLTVTFIKFKRNEYFTYTTFLSEGFANFKKLIFVIIHMFLKLLPFILVLFLTIIITFITGYTAVSSSSSLGLSFLSLIASIVYLVVMILMAIKSLSFSLVFFILYDEPSLSAKEIVEKSISLMTNNRWRYFCLGLSFIGWAMLSAFTFGIGILFLTPYMQISFICFYDDLVNNANSTMKKDDDNNDENDVIKEM